MNEAVTISIKNEDGSLEPLQLGTDKVFLQQDPLLPFLFSGTYWPNEAGWLPQVDIKGKINWLYIYQKNDWKTLNSVDKLIATNLYASSHQPVTGKKLVTKKDVPVSVPKIYFFIIFILSAGFLVV